MPTNKDRLDQLEPLMADALQKIDRLIEGQGQLVELAVQTKEDVTQTKAEVSTIKTDVGQTKTEVGTIKTDVSQTKTEVGTMKAELEQVKITGDSTARALANLTVYVQQSFVGVRQDIIQIDSKIDSKVDGLRAEMNQRFDQIIDLIRNKLP